MERKKEKDGERDGLREKDQVMPTPAPSTDVRAPVKAFAEASAGEPPLPFPGVPLC